MSLSGIWFWYSCWSKASGRTSGHWSYKRHYQTKSGQQYRCCSMYQRKISIFAVLHHPYHHKIYTSKIVVSLTKQLLQNAQYNKRYLYNQSIPFYWNIIKRRYKDNTKKRNKPLYLLNLTQIQAIWNAIWFYLVLLLKKMIPIIKIMSICNKILRKIL